MWRRYDQLLEVFDDGLLRLMLREKGGIGRLTWDWCEVELWAQPRLEKEVGFWRANLSCRGGSSWWSGYMLKWIWEGWQGAWFLGFTVVWKWRCVVVMGRWWFLVELITGGFCGLVVDGDMWCGLWLRLCNGDREIMCVAFLWDIFMYFLCGEWRGIEEDEKHAGRKWWRGSVWLFYASLLKEWMGFYRSKMGELEGKVVGKF